MKRKAGNFASRSQSLSSLQNSSFGLTRSSTKAFLFQNAIENETDSDENLKKKIQTEDEARINFRNKNNAQAVKQDDITTNDNHTPKNPKNNYAFRRKKSKVNMMHTIIIYAVKIFVAFICIL